MKEILRITHGMQRNGPLRDINLEVYRGEIVVIQGLAGSGIRTLLDVLSGKTGLDGGRIDIEEKQAPLRRDHSSLWRHIYVSTKGRNQAENLSLAENFEIQRHPSSYLRYYSTKKAKARAERYFKQEGMDIDPEAGITQLSPEVQHELNLMQARMQHASLAVMDDMLSMNSELLDGKLLQRMLRMRLEGTSFLILSYHGNRFQNLADRIVTLSRGRDVFEQSRGEFEETNIPLFPNIRVSDQVHAVGLLAPDPSTESMNECMRNIRNRNPEAWEQEIGFQIPSGDNVTDGRTVLIPARSAERLCDNLSVRDNVIMPLSRKAPHIPGGYINPRIAETAYRDCCRMTGIDPGVKTPGELPWVHRKILTIDRWRLTKPAVIVLENPYYALDNREVEQLQQYLIRLAETGIRLVILSDSMEVLFSLCTSVFRVEGGQIMSVKNTAIPHPQ